MGKEYNKRKAKQQSIRRKNYREQREQQYIQSSTYIRQQNRKTLEKTWAKIFGIEYELKTFYPEKIDKSNKELRNEKTSLIRKQRQLENIYCASNSLDTLIK